MRLQDITDAINADGEADIRHVFQVLVDYPNEDIVEDATSERLKSALVAMCDCLSGPGEGAAIMPQQLRQLIANAVGVAPASLALLRYKDGAKCVRAHLHHWLDIFSTETTAKHA